VDLDEEEDKYHHPRWCPDGLNRSQKRKVQRLRSLEEAEAKYIESLRKPAQIWQNRSIACRKRSLTILERSGDPSWQKPM
jgi:hypothetical protein